MRLYGHIETNNTAQHITACIIQEYRRRKWKSSWIDRTAWFADSNWKPRRPRAIIASWNWTHHNEYTRHGAHNSRCTLWIVRTFKGYWYGHENRTLVLYYSGARSAVQTRGRKHRMYCFVTSRILCVFVFHSIPCSVRLARSRYPVVCSLIALSFTSFGMCSIWFECPCIYYMVPMVLCIMPGCDVYVAYDDCPLPQKLNDFNSSNSPFLHGMDIVFMAFVFTMHFAFSLHSARGYDEPAERSIYLWSYFPMFFLDIEFDFNFRNAQFENL